MLKVRKALILVFVFAIVFVCNSNVDANMGGEVRYWFTTLDSEVKITDDALVGTKIDLEDDLGVDEKEDFVEFRVFYKSGKHKLRYSFVSMSWEGEKTTTKTLLFSGKTYSATAFVQTELDIDYHRLGYEYLIIEKDKYNVGFIFEVKYFDLDARVRAIGAGLDESESVGIPLPAIGLSFNAQLFKDITFEAEFTGFTVGSAAYVYDAELLIGYRAHKNILLSAGLKTFTLHGDDEDDEIDFKVGGPFVMVRATF